MSKIAKVLDHYRETYPEPACDWRFRAGRMAEEIVELRIQMSRLKRESKRKTINLSCDQKQNDFNGYIYLTAMDSKLESPIKITSRGKTFIDVKTPQGTTHRIKKNNPVLNGYKVRIFEKGKRVV